MLVIKRDRWQSTSQRASNVWALLSECIDVYCWCEWLYSWRIDTKARGVEIAFYRKRKCICFFSQLPKKENLLIRIRSTATWADPRGTPLSRSSSSKTLLAVIQFFLYRCVVLRSLSSLKCDKLKLLLTSHLLRDLWTFATLGLAWDRTSWTTRKVCTVTIWPSWPVINVNEYRSRLYIEKLWH
jgi:hypothetical protein